MGPIVPFPLSANEIGGEGRGGVVLSFMNIVFVSK